MGDGCYPSDKLGTSYQHKPMVPVMGYLQVAARGVNW